MKYFAVDGDLSRFYPYHPNPQDFFNSVQHCLRSRGRLIFRDKTSDNALVTWVVNHIELPLANLFGKGDVTMASRKTIHVCAEKAGLTVERFEIRKGMRLHSVIRKTRT